MTTDYTAHDIHRLDQAYPDALADIERFTGNPANKNRLAEVGPEVYAAELTRDLAYYTDNPMSLAGWAAIATVRLMDAGKAWEEDTEMAYDQRDAAQAMADELRAELEKVRGQLTDTRHRADGLAADLRSLQHGHDAYANENAELKASVQKLIAFRNVKVWEADELAKQLKAVREFVEGKSREDFAYIYASDILAVLGERHPAESRPAVEFDATKGEVA